MPFDENTHRLGLPARPFLYTMDQIVTLLQVSETHLHQSIVYHEGRDIGIRDLDHMRARNISRPNEKPEWRVAEPELKRWLRRKGFKYYDRGTVTM